MITENLSTLKIHNLTKEQYERELAAGRIDENALYLTPASPCFVMQSDEPEDTSVVWIDVGDNSFDNGYGLYLSDVERELVVQDVLAALGTPVFGTVDAENNIILTGELENGTYTLKYEHADGSLTTIGTLEHITDENTGTTDYTNQIPVSTDTDGSIYNGSGYMMGKRISSSWAVSDVNNMDATSLVFLTGFIPVKKGDTVRMKNCYVYSDYEYDEDIFGIATGSLKIAFYKSDKTQHTQDSWALAESSDAITDFQFSGDNLLTGFTVVADVAYMRISLAPTGNAEDAILTVNEALD